MRRSVARKAAISRRANVLPGHSDTPPPNGISGGGATEGEDEDEEDDEDEDEDEEDDEDEDEEEAREGAPPPREGEELTPWRSAWPGGRYRR